MKKNAFTLLELLIVIIIIGILAAFAIPRYIRAARKAVASEAVTNIGSLRGALARYYQEWGVILDEADWDNLDIENPNNIQGRKFNYYLDSGSYDPNTGALDLELRAEGITGTRGEGITVTYKNGEINIEIQ